MWHVKEDQKIPSGWISSKANFVCMQLLFYGKVSWNVNKYCEKAETTTTKNKNKKQKQKQNKTGGGINH